MLLANALVILSGGQDSTTCLYWAKEQFENVYALSFNYRQRHGIELQAASHIAKLAGVPHEVLDLGPLFHGVSPLTDPNQKLETYTSADTLPGGLENTFVPGRNLLFLAAAANRAYVLECQHLVIGVSEEDFGGYPDCRASFIQSMEHTISQAMDKPFTIAMPLVHLNKKATVELAQSLPGCMDALAWSHTCYAGTVPPCGTCHACLLRARGFAEAGVADPLTERLQQESKSA